MKKYSALIKYVHEIASSVAVVSGTTIGRTRAEVRKAISFYRALGYPAELIDISERCGRCEGRGNACRTCRGKGFVVVEAGR